MTRLSVTTYSIFFTLGMTMPENLTSPTPKCAALAGGAKPAEEKADELPERIEPQTTGHDRIALEMAGKKPEIGLHIEFGDDLALAVLTAGIGNMGDAVEHQHRRQGQLRIAGPEQFAAGASQQVLVEKIRFPFRHWLLQHRSPGSSG